MGAIAIFGAANKGLDPMYLTDARELGAQIAASGRALVFGGGGFGVMGACARGAKEAGGRVIGVVPESLHKPGILFPACDELIVTRDLRDRMSVMAEKCDAFVTLAGGFGTFYELFEVLTLSKLAYHAKPIAILNTKGFYDGMLGQFETAYREGCVEPRCRALYGVADAPGDVLRILNL